ncbi:hypothetical protein ABEB36_002053 [Hypothenemus hampei]|uniref:Large ribosomal subunit protein bL9m n=1 Tax=Hypothenemus hampei TaxID=57062 RepID=A0ABD1F4E7_HYPHA
MWRNSLNVLSKATFQQFLLKSVCQKEQIRTTFILKRKYAPLLSKKGSPPKKLKARQHIYELVKDTKLEKRPNIDVILTSFVDGLGNIGEKVSVKPQYGYNHLILPGLAVYATSENEEKYKKYALRDDQVKYSSPNALLMIHALQRMCLSVIMNREHVWTLKPWHIKVSFRKCGYVVPEDAITLPEKHIKGPDMNLENKEFYVTVTVSIDINIVGCFSTNSVFIEDKQI